MCQLGKERVDGMVFSADSAQINEWLEQVREFRCLQDKADNFPLQHFYDMREAVARLRLEGTHLDEGELFDLRRSLDTICLIVDFFSGERGEDYPALRRLTEEIQTFPDIVRGIDAIIDKYGKVRDEASAELMRIRKELSNAEGSISRTLYGILRVAQSEGLVDKDAAPAMRDGRLMLPVAPSLKRKIRGIVHDESASGKTVFIEPAEVVEANNRVRELESAERREITHILKEFAALIRPRARLVAESYCLLADIDFIRCKVEFARLINGCEPQVDGNPRIDFIHAEHPLLKLALDKQGKRVVPLDITLDGDRRILIISGPNAGGKSVCLKTVGLLQYMLQCGVPVPVGERTVAGVFNNILIDIGDEQSIENDLSTYSSHLMNMKVMMRRADGRTLLLIDEFGSGTEPQIGGAIAESVLRQLCRRGAYAVITTHYQNLKHFADDNEGVVNGAMLYDRNAMQPLFQLAIGQPGSSFAIEIARKIGLPEDVIREASDIVGSEYIQSDKYLQDIVRDKRYWENKRQSIRRQEKDMREAMDRYEEEMSTLRQQRRDILQRAKEQAEELLSESNRRIERTIREIKECQAERDDTRRIRSELDAFKAEVEAIDASAGDEAIERKMKQIQRRRERREKRRKDRAAVTNGGEVTQSTPTTKGDGGREARALSPGDTVRMKGLTAVGTVESLSGGMAAVVFGGMKTRVSVERLEPAEPPKRDEARPYMSVSRQTREAIDKRRLDFKQDIDVRGMRGDEALSAVTYFIDDAILVGADRVRILHGTGTGALRQLIRQYLATVPAVVSCRDEHVQFGGAGITVVDLEA